MALAAEELTETSFLAASQADRGRLFPALTRHRQFQGLFHHQMLMLPDGSVDFTAKLSLAVQACFDAAASCLLADFEVIAWLFVLSMAKALGKNLADMAGSHQQSSFKLATDGLLITLQPDFDESQTSSTGYASLGLQHRSLYKQKLQGALGRMISTWLQIACSRGGWRMLLQRNL